MSFTLTSIPVVGQYLESYRQNLPNDIPKAILKSGLISFGISAIFNGNYQTAARSAGFGLALAAIANLATPFFKYAFANEKGDFDGATRLGRHIVSIGITKLLTNSLTSYKVELKSPSLVALIILSQMMSDNCHSSTPTSPVVI